MPGGGQQFPALNLYPLNDSFVPKHISLAGGVRVKIGRQTNAKTVPGEKNGYFDSKVLSRQHAEVWEEGGKIYIKDVKSSNGTFINNSRLSQEGVESQPFELNTDDIVEFGIDIVGEDNQTIIHHKVSAKVQCILNQDDVNAAQQHAIYAQQAQQHSMVHGQQGMMQQSQPGQRRPSLHGQSHSGNLGALAPVGRVPNKTGLSFDFILSKLQNELQRSRDTAVELHSLTGAMSDIHDSLGGVAAHPIPAYPHVLPPVRHDSDPSGMAMPGPPQQDTAILNTLQDQLHETQSLLTTHVEKMRTLGLEGMVGEHDGLKREIGMLRELIDQRKRDAEVASDLQRSKSAHDDDDDTRSVATIVPEDQYHDEEIEEENEEARRQRQEELGRPRTPEPSMGLDGDSDGEGDIGMRGIGIRRPTRTIRGVWDANSANNATLASRESVEKLTDRFDHLVTQFESSLELSRTLQLQQIAAQETIASLQAKVDQLESLKEMQTTSPAPEPIAITEENSPVISNLVQLTKTLETRWERQQEEWIDEKERLRAAKEEWEKRVRRVEDDLTGVREIASSAKVAAADAHATTSSLAKSYSALTASLAENGPGIQSGNDQDFAPPSPRSISSDGFRKRTRSGRSRSRSTSPSPPAAIPNGHSLIGTDDSPLPYSPTSLHSASMSSHSMVNGQAIENHGHGDGRKTMNSAVRLKAVDRAKGDRGLSSTISSTPGRKADLPVPYISAVFTVGVALLGVAVWNATTHVQS